MTDYASRAGGATTDADAYVSVDGTTISGNGTADNPLRVIPTGAAGDVFEYPAPVILPGFPYPGTPVYPAGVASFGYGDAGELVSALISGVVVTGRANFFSVQRSGIVVLTTAQWDVITAGSGGLTTGTMYYVSNTTGKITPYTTLSLGHGLFISQVGWALSSTEMQLQIGGCSPVAVTP